MKSKLSSLSIFFPAFNEEKNVPIVVGHALEVAPKLTDRYEVIVVDDGSSDQTAAVVKNLSSKNKQVRLIQHQKNKGYGAALKSGFYASKYDYITYMDCDGQFDFNDLTKLVAQIDQADLVIGYRIKRADNWVRILNAKLWNLLISILLGLRFKDLDCGFKLIRKEVLEKIPKLESDGATISSELLVKAKKQGFKIVQVGLPHYQRKYGQQTHGNPIHILRAFKDLFLLIPKV